MARVSSMAVRVAWRCEAVARAHQLLVAKLLVWHHLERLDRLLQVRREAERCDVTRCHCAAGIEGRSRAHMQRRKTPWRSLRLHREAGSRSQENVEMHRFCHEVLASSHLAALYQATPTACSSSSWRCCLSPSKALACAYPSSASAPSFACAIQSPAPRKAARRQQMRLPRPHRRPRCRRLYLLRTPPPSGSSSSPRPPPSSRAGISSVLSS